MKLSRYSFVILGLLLVLTLLGCTEQSTPEAQPTATEYAYPAPLNDPAEVVASLTAIPEEEATEANEESVEPEPTEAIAAEPQVDNCVECHTDQQTLMDTADPVAEVESENEGEG
jgi:hypothetical protein